jgi:hypothetical protein
MHSSDTGEKNGSTMTAYDSVRREVLYNIFIEFGVTMKLVRLIKMCLNETYSEEQDGNFACGSVWV